MEATTNFVSTSGWTEDELFKLRDLVDRSGTDRSKVIRMLVRKEHDRWQRAIARAAERTHMKGNGHK